MRTILHVDMNAFFAAVSQQSNPVLRGRPVAVTGREQRTIILTASYEARAHGVKTGMRLHEARELCPELTLVPADNRLYTHVSSEIMAMLHDYTPLVEVFSIDEAFLDLSGSLRLFGGAERIAYLIKSRIKARFGITCSVGIAANKLLAKLASEQQKPDGLTVFAAEAVPALLETMPIGELCGIGRSLARQLNLLGIFTCGQLGRFPLPLLRRKFGIVGERLQAMGRGHDDSPVVPEGAGAPIKTVGHSMTLRRDLSDRGEIQTFLLQLSEMVGRRARRYGVAGRTVTLTLRYADFTTFSRQQAQAGYLDRTEAIYRASLAILDGLVLEQPVRLLGVRLSGLRHQADQLPLLAEEQRAYGLTAAADCINDRYGDFCLMSASLLEQTGKGSHVISPAWRPAGIRRVTVL